MCKMSERIQKKLPMVDDLGEKKISAKIRGRQFFCCIV